MKVNMKDILKDEKPPGTNVGKAVVVSFPSSSRQGMKHYTMVLDDGKTICSCEGFQMHKKCWHLEGKVSYGD